MLYVMEETELVGCKEVREASFEDYQKLIPNDVKLALAEEYLASLFRDTDPLTSPEQFKLYLATRVEAKEHECFGIVVLDNQHRVITDKILFTGTINAASVYPREVVKLMLEHNGSACAFYHNHPSGVAEPSQADRRITSRLVDALALVDCRVLDHFVIGSRESVSFAERGWI